MEMTDWNDEKQCLEAVREDGRALKFVKNQTDEIVDAAIRNNLEALRFVKVEQLEVS